MKQSTLKTQILASYGGLEVVRSSCYRKIWCGIYSFLYTFNVLVDHRDPPQPCTL